MPNIKETYYRYEPIQTRNGYVLATVNYEGIVEPSGHPRIYADYETAKASADNLNRLRSYSDEMIKQES